MTLPMVTLPEPRLREPSQLLTVEMIRSKKIKTLIAEMIPKMHQEDGIGLAAPQIGENIQLCIVGKDAFKKGYKATQQAFDVTKDLVLINPVIQRMTKKTEIDYEGCLSVRKVGESVKQFGKVKRFKHIQVTALNESGDKIQFLANSFFARVIQHEVDHLHGILYIDKATSMYEVEA